MMIIFCTYNSTTSAFIGCRNFVEIILFLLTLFLQEEADLIDRNELQQFLASADFLSNYGMSTLISNMQAAASEVLKG